MTRPLRLEFPGAVYHLTARGDRREDIFLDDADRQTFLDLLVKEIRQQVTRQAGKGPLLYTPPSPLFLHDPPPSTPFVSNPPHQRSEAVIL